MEKKVLYFQHPWSPNALDLLGGFNEGARKNGWQVELISDKIPERAFARLVDRAAPLGCVVARPLKTAAGLTAFLGRPTVFLSQEEQTASSPVSRKASLSSEPWGVLTFDQAAVGRLAAETFAKLRIADHTYCPFKASPRHDWCVRRETQFRRAVQDAGGRYVPFPRNLRKLPHGCGILAANDSTAQQLMTSFQKCGLRVPQDVLVIGVDNIEIVCNNTHPALTSIDQGFPLAGKAAAEMLRDILRTRRGLLRLYSAATVVLRGSTEVARQGDPRVADALACIREDLADTTLNVARVAERMGCARRTADLIFTRETGRTIGREIRLRRLELACRLLANPRQLIGPIANLCGYSSPVVFKRMFKSETGMTMREWRKKRLPGTSGYLRKTHAGEKYEKCEKCEKQGGSGASPLSSKRINRNLSCLTDPIAHERSGGRDRQVRRQDPRQEPPVAHHNGRRSRADESDSQTRPCRPSPAQGQTCIRCPARPKPWPVPNQPGRNAGRRMRFY